MRFPSVLWVALLVGLAACAAPPPQPTPMPTTMLATPPEGLFYGQGTACFAGHYAGPIGLEVGGRGQMLAQFITSDDARVMYGEAAIDLHLLETFTVLEGPTCWQMRATSSTAIITQGRLWRVRAESRDLEGWISEYARTIIGVDYLVAPLEGDSPGIVAGNALPEPASFSGVFGGGVDDKVQPITHTIEFADYGYVAITIQTTPPDTGNPDLARLIADCRVSSYILVEPVVSMLSPTHKTTLELLGPTMVAYGETIDRLFVEPDVRLFTLEAIYTAETTPPATPYNCSGLSYTLTVTPVSP